MWASGWAQCWLSTGWADPLPANAIVSIFSISIYHRRILLKKSPAWQETLQWTPSFECTAHSTAWKSSQCKQDIKEMTQWPTHWLTRVYTRIDQYQCNDLTCWPPWKTRRSDRRQTGTSWQTPDLRSDWFLSLEKSFWWEPAAVLCQS